MICFQQIEGVLLGDIELSADMALLGETAHIRMETFNDPAVFAMPSKWLDTYMDIYIYVCIERRDREAETKTERERLKERRKCMHQRKCC